MYSCTNQNKAMYQERAELIITNYSRQHSYRIINEFDIRITDVRELDTTRNNTTKKTRLCNTKKQ